MPEMVGLLLRRILGILFLFGLYWVYDRYFVRAYAAGELPFFEEKEPQIEVSTVLLESFDEQGQKKMELYGRKATVDEKEKSIRIQPMTIVMYEQGRAGTLMVANRGLRREGKPEYYELEGDVEATTRDGRKLFSHKLIYYPRIEKVVSPGVFKLIDGAHIIEGEYLEYFLHLEKGEMRGNVKMRFHERLESVQAERDLGLMENGT